MSIPLQPSPPSSHQASYLSGVTALLSGFADPILGQYGKLHNLRNDLFGTVSNPGNVESLGKDVKSLFSHFVCIRSIHSLTFLLFLTLFSCCFLLFVQLKKKK